MKNTLNYPVMSTQCSTCPFRTDDNGLHSDPQLVSTIQSRILSNASQICHHPRLHDNQETHLCRGARDFQLMIYHRLGFLSEPTDQAWDEKCRELKIK